EHVLSFARAMLAQLVTLHSPEDVLVAVASAGKAKRDWEWVKWLPHAQHPTLTDGIGQLRMMASSLQQIEDWLAEELAPRPRFQRKAPYTDGPHIVIIVDDADISREERIVIDEGLAGVTVLDISGQLNRLAARRGLRLEVKEGQPGARNAGGGEWCGTPDSLSLAEAAAIARRISPYRIGTTAQGEEEEDHPLMSNPGLLELLGIPGDAMTFDVQQAWRPRPIRDRYRVP